LSTEVNHSNSFLEQTGGETSAGPFAPRMDWSVMGETDHFVQFYEADAFLLNSLGEYMASLASLTTTLPFDALVLPGHGVPFYGLKTRIKQLADHHEERCRMIAQACLDAPKTSAQLVPVVFHKHALDPHQMGFAAGELIAHVNYMLVEGRLTAEEIDGVLWFRTT